MIRKALFVCLSLALGSEAGVIKRIIHPVSTVKHGLAPVTHPIKVQKRVAKAVKWLVY